MTRTLVMSELRRSLWFAAALAMAVLVTVRCGWPVALVLIVASWIAGSVLSGRWLARELDRKHDLERPPAP